MHRRVQNATLAAVVVAVVLLGLPLAVGAVVIQTAQARSSAASRADAVVAALDAALLAEPDAERTATGPSAAMRRQALRSGERAARWPQTVTLTSAGQTPARLGPDAAAGVAAASQAADGTHVRVVVPRSALWIADARLLALVAALAAGAVVAGWIVALVAARRLSEPLERLARRAEQLGTGQVPPSAGHSGIEEVDQVARALARSAQRLASRLAAEREFASDVSHQLRTPLTALSMRLEEIESTSDQPEVAAEAQQALMQVERLSGVVADLLARARSRPTGPPRPTALAPVLSQQQQEWSGVFTRAGRRLAVNIAGEAAAAQIVAAAGPVSQALATLVENSLVHGEGPTVVAARRGGEWVVVEVSDAGQIAPDVAARVFDREFSTAARSGLGLALARDLLAGEGGRLELVRSRPTTFALFLPMAGGTASSVVPPVTGGGAAPPDLRTGRAEGG